MLKAMNLYLCSIQVISEEHDDSSILVPPVKINRQCSALDHVSKVEWVPSSSITVWIVSASYFIQLLINQ